MFYILVLKREIEILIFSSKLGLLSSTFFGAACHFELLCTHLLKSYRICQPWTFKNNWHLVNTFPILVHGTHMDLSIQKKKLFENLFSGPWDLQQIQKVHFLGHPVVLRIRLELDNTTYFYRICHLCSSKGCLLTRAMSSKHIPVLSDNSCAMKWYIIQMISCNSLLKVEMPDNNCTLVCSNFVIRLLEIR